MDERLVIQGMDKAQKQVEQNRADRAIKTEQLHRPYGPVNTMGAERAETVLRELVAAYEWRAECRTAFPYNPIRFVGNYRLRCYNRRNFGNDELRKNKQQAEDDYRAAFEAAKVVNNVL